MDYSAATIYKNYNIVFSNWDINTFELVVTPALLHYIALKKTLCRKGDTGQHIVLTHRIV